MYKTLDTRQTPELQLLRHGWFSPEYELVDRGGSYGKLMYNWISNRTARVETAAGGWTFSFERLFSRTLLITDQNGQLIGTSTREWFTRRRLLNLQSGFRAEFYRPLFTWRREYIWESEGYGEIMRIRYFPLNLRDTVYIKPGMTPPALMPLLIFLGSHLTVLNKRRNAAG